MTENMTDPKPSPQGIKHRLGRLRSGMASRREGRVAQSLDPAYTEYIGRQLLQALEIAY